MYGTTVGTSSPSNRVINNNNRNKIYFHITIIFSSNSQKGAIKIHRTVENCDNVFSGVTI